MCSDKWHKWRSMIPCVGPDNDKVPRRGDVWDCLKYGVDLRQFPRLRKFVVSETVVSCKDIINSKMIIFLKYFKDLFRHKFLWCGHCLTSDSRMRKHADTVYLHSEGPVHGPAADLTLSFVQRTQCCQIFAHCVVWQIVANGRKLLCCAMKCLLPHVLNST